MSDGAKTLPVGTSQADTPAVVRKGDVDVGDGEFHAGAEIHCRMKGGQPIVGEVISHEKSANVLVIQEAAQHEGPGAKRRIAFVNLSHVEMIDTSSANSSGQCASFSTQAQPPPDREALEEAKKRLRREERKHSALWLGDAPPEAVRTFVNLKKIYSATAWDANSANIRVLKDVVVKEPYDETSVECTSDQHGNKRSSSLQAVEHVRKVLSQSKGRPP